MMKKTRYCLCGASIHVADESKEAVAGALAIWQKEHTGDGHGPATAFQARRARIKNDEQATR